MQYPSISMERAVTEFSKLPGIGRKSAQRVIFYLLKLPGDEVRQLAEALVAMKENVKFCSTCFNITEQDRCRICTDEKRDCTTLCVVEEANDVLALERTAQFRGRYHVLGGALSPLEGIGPDDLHIKELMTRLGDTIQEVIIATNPNAEGEATAVYLEKLIKPMAIKVTRIARGLPVGGDLEYADEITLTRALEGRVVL